DAVLSDIHSNLEALNAVLDHLAGERIDRYLCLGDAVGYGADPEACLGRLRACQAISVCGNHEWACLGKLDLEWFNELAKRSVLWTRDRLSFADLDRLRRLPLVATEGPCTFVHGAFHHPERFEYLVEVGQAVETFRRCHTAYCLTGHTHVPVVYEYDLEQHRVSRILTSPHDLAEVHVSNDPTRFRYVVNPGSVGQPRDGDAKASCAILDTEGRLLTLHRVAYDIPTAQRKIRQAGLPELFADRLAIGR
ncbi:MAG: metallophosphoesterase family protein, partial [Candidatus Omnitrophica bacterium]|nr:metallophosphoesterase family protein [Candidatus Omnitrophota bacterium]